MKKAAHILHLIGGIASMAFAATFLVFAIVLIVFSTPAYTDAIIKALQEGKIHTTFVGTVEQQAAAIQSTFLGVGITFAILVFFVLINGILAFIALKKNNVAINVLNIVFAVLSGMTVNGVGSILAICNRIMERDEESQVIEEEKE